MTPLPWSPMSDILAISMAETLEFLVVERIKFESGASRPLTSVVICVVDESKRFAANNVDGPNVTAIKRTARKATANGLKMFTKASPT